MIQRFSLWKTIVVIVSLVLGTLYGLPNGFPDDPAVQITSNRSTEVLGELDVIRAEDALKEAGITPIALDFEGSQALIRFDSVETQIKAKSLLHGTQKRLNIRRECAQRPVHAFQRLRNGSRFHRQASHPPNGNESVLAATSV